MAAGENTLNARCARVVWRAMAALGGYSAPPVLDAYVTFMTTPGSHNDTYAVRACWVAENICRMSC